MHRRHWIILNRKTWGYFDRYSYAGHHWNRSGKADQSNGLWSKNCFLTGYAEFEYARYGIEYKVFDYLLKPVDEQEAIKCLNRAISAFHAEQKHTEMYQIFQDYFVKNQGADQTTICGKTLFQPVIFQKNRWNCKSRSCGLQ